jgi:hypothetical protein
LVGYELPGKCKNKTIKSLKVISPGGVQASSSTTARALPCRCDGFRGLISRFQILWISLSTWVCTVCEKEARRCSLRKLDLFGRVHYFEQLFGSASVLTHLGTPLGVQRRRNMVRCRRRPRQQQAQCHYDNHVTPQQPTPWIGERRYECIGNESLMDTHIYAMSAKAFPAQSNLYSFEQVTQCLEDQGWDTCLETERALRRVYLHGLPVIRRSLSPTTVPRLVPHPVPPAPSSPVRRLQPCRAFYPAHKLFLCPDFPVAGGQIRF